MLNCWFDFLGNRLTPVRFWWPSIPTRFCPFTRPSKLKCTGSGKSANCLRTSSPSATIATLKWNAFDRISASLSGETWIVSEITWNCGRNSISSWLFQYVQFSAHTWVTLRGYLIIYFFSYCVLSAVSLALVKLKVPNWFCNTWRPLAGNIRGSSSKSLKLIPSWKVFIYK